MMVELSVVPLGKGASVGSVVARVIKIIVESGVPYKANPMGTVIEGEWQPVMELARRCHEEAMRDAERVVTTIKIDDYKGKGPRLEGKFESVESKLGIRLNR